MSQWLKELETKGSSWVYNQNFLWRNNNIYIMDNHRAALWCWLQQLDKTKKYKLFHIDQHYDTLNSRINEWKKHLPDLWNISIDEYLEYTYKIQDLGNPKLFRYDNYLSIFLECFSELIESTVFVTQKEGSIPDKKYNISEFEIKHLPGNLDYWLSGSNNWIINLDIDFFFYKVEENKHIQLYSDELIIHLSKIIKKYMVNNSITVLTIALSPETSDGWNRGERVLQLLCNELDISFKI